VVKDFTFIEASRVIDLDESVSDGMIGLAPRSDNQKSSHFMTELYIQGLVEN
jgi:hypothetical protein